MATPVRGADTDFSRSYSKALGALERERPEDAFALVAAGAAAGDAPSMFLSGFLQDIGAGAQISHGAANALLKKSAAKRFQLAVRYLAWKHTTGFGFEEPDPAAAEKLLGQVPGNFMAARGIAGWITVKDGMCEPNLTVALNWMIDRAATGNPIAEANLATAFLEAGWTQPDLKHHLYWLTRAADRKEPESMLRLAVYIELGVFGEPDRVRAFELIRSAAEVGHLEAAFLCAGRFEDGEGTDRDVAAAVEWYRKAGERGHVEAMLRLGSLLRRGEEGAPRDYSEALRWSLEAAGRGDVRGMTEAADMLRQGQGAPADFPRALRLYEQAAEAGYAYAADMLGWIAANGEGGGSPDFQAARSWYEKAAAGGNRHAMRELAMMFESGNGVPKDEGKAFEWVERAARDGDAWSQNRMGFMLRLGIGIEKDAEEAVTWFELAAKNGSAIAHGNLAFHYVNGLGVPADNMRAFEESCLCLSEIKDQWTRANLRRICSRMTDLELERLCVRIKEIVSDPKLMESEGALPEAVLEILSNKRVRSAMADTAFEDEYVRRLGEAERQSSYTPLAWRHFIGDGKTCDIEKARAFIHRAVAANDIPARAMEAFFETVCAETEEEREDALRRLRDLADEGNREAARFVAHNLRYAAGDRQDDAGADHFERIALGVPPGVDIDAFRPRSTASSLKQISAGEFEALKARVPLSEERIPVLVHQVAPFYPFELNVERIDGDVLVAFEVNEEGIPGNIRVLRSSNPLFARAAVVAIAMWRFAPGIKAGKTVATKLEQPLRFTHVDDEDQPSVTHLEEIP